MFTLSLAQKLDQEDPLSHFRERFHFPVQNGKRLLYFCGNSLGLQPKGVKEEVERVLTDWAEKGVYGHHSGEDPWMFAHHTVKESLAKLTGAKPSEVTAMGGLTANLHFLLVSFFKPTGNRNKIIMEKNAFPSDLYLVKSQLQLHGLDADEFLVLIAPKEGKDCIEEDDILDTIANVGESLALVFLGANNYLTGQHFDLKVITEASHKVGAKCGFDLAHTIGNNELKLHDWGVDFAAWCSYKYLNAGPGAIGGIFVHDKYAKDDAIFRLSGWWGHDERTRFEMPADFEPMYGSDAWQHSNPPMLQLASLRASLKLFDEAGMERLREKSVSLSEVLETVLRQEIGELIQQTPYENLEIVTPKEPNRRGAQLSLRIGKNGKDLFAYLTASGVVVDWREPDIIRISPTPLYTSFEVVYRLKEILLMHLSSF